MYGHGETITVASWDLLIAGDILSPNKTVIKDIESISTGYDHCLAIGEDGNIYSWGDNGFGQLGVTGITTYRPRSRILTFKC